MFCEGLRFVLSLFIACAKRANSFSSNGRYTAAIRSLHNLLYTQSKVMKVSMVILKIVLIDIQIDGSSK